MTSSPHWHRRRPLALALALTLAFAGCRKTTVSSGPTASATPPRGRAPRSGPSVSSGGAFVDWSGGEASLEAFFAFATHEKDNGTFVHSWSPGAGVKSARFGFGGPDAPKRTALPRLAKYLIGPTGVDSVRDGAGIMWDAKAKTLKLASSEGVVVTDLPSTVNPPHAVLSPTGGGRSSSGTTPRRAIRLTATWP